MKKFLFLFLLLTSSWIVQSDPLLPPARRISLKEKIAALIMIGIEGDRVSEEDSILTYLRQGLVSNIVLNEGNISLRQSEQKFKVLTTAIKKAKYVNILFNEEGGRKSQLKMRRCFKNRRSLKKVGRRNNDDYTEAAADAFDDKFFDLVGIGSTTVDYKYFNPTERKLLGIFKRKNHLNSNRAIHNTGLYMDELGLTKSVLKFFPTLKNNWGEGNLGPIKKLAQEKKLLAIMTSHNRNMRLDSSNVPMTLSKKMINGLLRKKIGHNNIVIISEDMQMDAIVKHYGFKQSIKMALLAGVDILCCNKKSSNSKYTAREVHATITQLVWDGEISREQITRSYERVSAWRSGYYYEADHQF